MNTPLLKTTPKMNYIDLSYTDLKDGTGRMVVLSVAGCSHHCEGCNKKYTWDFDGGKPFDEDAKKTMMSMMGEDDVVGLILTGGEPMDSYNVVANIITDVKYLYTLKKIWLYTGYTLCDAAKKDVYAVLDKVDMVVDGPYMEELRDDTHPYKASKNQTIWKREGFVYNKSELN